MALPPTQNAKPAMANNIHANPSREAFQNDLVAPVMLLEGATKTRVAPKLLKNPHFTNNPVLRVHTLITSTGADRRATHSALLNPGGYPAGWRARSATGNQELYSGPVEDGEGIPQAIQ
jgi:hypothetical protein